MVGRFAEARQILANPSSAPTAGAEEALAYFALGEKDRGFAFLRRNFEERSGLLIFMKHDPNYDNVRSDPRFQSLVAKLGIPEPR
jgi:hypothetical protein